MPSDSFGNIRIKPDENKITPEHHDGAIKTDHDRNALPSEPGEDVPFRRQTSHVARRRKVPFKPGKAMLWIAIPIFLVLLYGVGSYFLVPLLIKGPVSKSLSESFDRPVQVKRVVFSPFSLRVYLTDILIGPVYGNVNKENLLECAGFSFRLDFPALFRRQLVCREVKINGVLLNLFRFRLGAFDITDAFHFFSLLKERNDTMTWPAWLVLDGVNLTDSRILVDDDLTKKQHRVEQISFYFPSSEEARGGKDILPRLNAVINSSPVQVAGRWQKNAMGNMETRFTLRFSGIILKNYLPYLPVIQQSPFQLAGGQADFDVDFVIPEIRDDTRKVSFRLNTVIKDLYLLNRNGEQVLKVPEVRLEVQAFPQARQYIINNMLFISPEFDFTLRKTSAEGQTGLSFLDVKNFAMGLDTYPYGIQCEKFSWQNGIFRLAYGRQGKSSYLWNDVQLMLNGYANKTFSQQVEKKDVPASFSFTGKSQSVVSEMGFSAAGKIRQGWQIDGTMAVSNLDLKQYSRFLPVNISFTEGRADLESLFLLSAVSGAPETGKKAPLFSLSDGRLTVRDFIFLKKNKKVLAGKRLGCLKLEAEISVRQLSCDKLLLEHGDIYGNRVGLADLRKGVPEGAGWTISTRRLEITGSTLYKQLDNPFDKTRPRQFKINNFSLQADTLEREVHEQDNIQASGRIGKKGALNLTGIYSPVSGKGQMSASLKGADVRILKQYVSPWFVPEMKGGTIHAEGTYVVEDKVFTGTIQVDDLQSGQPKGPFVGWQRAVSEGVRIQLDPFFFQSDKTELTRPVIIPGISHAEKPVSIFIRPLQDKGRAGSVSLSTVHFEDGTLDLPEPVIAPGYQPKLTAVSGTLSYVGSGAMTFAIQGHLEGQGRFAVNGSAGGGQVNEYSLAVSDLPLGQFQAILNDNVGIEADTASGSWKQDIKRENGWIQVANRIRLQNIDPVPESPYFRVISMYTDDKFSLYFAGEDKLEEGVPRPFLLDTLIRGIQHDAVKAELSEQLILNRLLPELNLAGRALFKPGSAELKETESLSDYALLLSRRPFLRIELTANFDEESDASAIHEFVQVEEDRLREIENKRRAAERLIRVEREKARLEKLKNDSRGIVEEKIGPVELSENLQPLPSRNAVVSRKMLFELARKRNRAVYDYFVNRLSVKADRIVVSSQIGESGTNVVVAVQPYYFMRKM